MIKEIETNQLKPKGFIKEKIAEIKSLIWEQNRFLCFLRRNRFFSQGTIYTDIEKTVAGIKHQHNVLEQLGIVTLM